MRNSLIAICIHRLCRVYWFIFRPRTQGVKVLVLNQGKILMVRLTYYPNTWTFPGGGIHKNEDGRNAAIRECREETGIRLCDPEYLGSIDFDHEYKKDTVFVFRETIDDQELVIDGTEVAEAKWYGLDELPPIGDNAKKIVEFVGGGSRVEI